MDMKNKFKKGSPPDAPSNPKAHPTRPGREHRKNAA